MNKRLVTIITSVLVVGTVVGVAALNNPDTTGAKTDPPIVKEVKRQSDQLSNHEARITNTENDVKDIQNKTNTPPSTVRVEVPTANSTPSDPSEPEVPVVTVTGFREIVVDSLNTDCEITYSDGTTHRWRWKVIDPQGGWVESSNGGRQYLESTSMTGNCKA